MAARLLLLPSWALGESLHHHGLATRSPCWLRIELPIHVTLRFPPGELWLMGDVPLWGRVVHSRNFRYQQPPGVFERQGRGGPGDGGGGGPGGSSIGGNVFWKQWHFPVKTNNMREEEDESGSEYSEPADLPPPSDMETDRRPWTDLIPRFRVKVEPLTTLKVGRRGRSCGGGGGGGVPYDLEHERREKDGGHVAASPAAALADLVFVMCWAMMAAAEALLPVQDRDRARSRLQHPGRQAGTSRAQGEHDL